MKSVIKAVITEPRYHTSTIVASRFSGETHRKLVQRLNPVVNDQRFMQADLLDRVCRAQFEHAGASRPRRP